MESAKISISATMLNMKPGQSIHLLNRQVQPDVASNTANRLQKRGDGQWKVSRCAGDTTITRLA